jgi:hypothetical protein
MPVSNSTDFDQSENLIIRDALVLCGGLEDTESPSSEQESQARRALNRMVKAWSVKGLKAWCWNEYTLTLVASQASYTLGTGGDLNIDRPLRIENARKVITGTEETPVRIISRSEYMNLPSKDTDSEPVAVFYDPQLSLGVLYVWPSPASTYSIKFSGKQYIEDFDASTNTPYFPTEWLDAIVYNLAFRLCPMYEVTGEDRNTLGAMAREFLFDAENGDQEQGSLYLEPA